MPKSVNVSRGLSRFSSVYETEVLRFLRKSIRSKQAVRNAPRKIPGTKPAANDAPENFEPEPVPIPFGSVTLAAVGEGVLSPEPMAVAAALGKIDEFEVVGDAALCAKHVSPWHE